MRITKVTTKTGDGGKTSLGNGQRVHKNHPIINTLGELDYLNSIIGWAEVESTNESYSIELKNIQQDMWFLIIYSGLIVSIGAHMSLFYLYKFYPVGKVLPFYALFPVFGLIQTFIIFNEIPSLIMTLGGIIVVGSVFLIQKVK